MNMITLSEDIDRPKIWGIPMFQEFEEKEEVYKVEKERYEKNQERISQETWEESSKEENMVTRGIY